MCASSERERKKEKEADDEMRTGTGKQQLMMPREKCGAERERTVMKVLMCTFTYTAHTRASGKVRVKRYLTTTTMAET
jgi:hypothetical protein